MTARRTARPFLGVFLAQATLVVAWSLATPPDAAPDEHQHVVRAASVVRGDPVGEPSPVGGGARVVEVPAFFERYIGQRDCFAFNSRQPASCAPGLAGPGGTVAVNTDAGLAPPAYYAITGWPLALSSSMVGVYLARIASGLVAVAFLAAALALAVRARPGSLLLPGIVVAWTPMAQFLAGVLNPSSLEIGASVLLWTGGALLVDDDPLDDRMRRLAVTAATVGGVAFVLARQLSPLWLAVVAATLLILAPAGRLRVLAAERRVRAGAAAIAVAGSGAMAWLVMYNPLAAPASGAGGLAGLTRGEAFATSVGRLGFVYRTGLGAFGWLDTFLPAGIELLWTGLLALVLALGALNATRRRRLVLAGLAVVVVVLPALIESTQLDTSGPTWQGRYTLPLAVGLPILAGLGARADRFGTRPGAVTRLVVVVAAVAQAASYLVALRRYAVGTDGPWWFLGRSTWDAPLPMTVLVLLGLGGSAATAAALWRLSGDGNGSALSPRPAQR